MQNPAREKRTVWRRTILRAGLRVAAGCVLAVLVLWLSLPRIVSAEHLETELRTMLRLRGGLELESGSAPRLSLWPVPSLILSEVAARHADGTTLFEARRISAEFSVLATLAGSPHFPEVELDGPRFHLPETWNERLPSSGGDILELFSGIVREIPLDPLILTRRAFGELTIVDGSLIMNDRAGQLAIMQDIDATLSWPDPDETFKGSASADIAGHRLRAEFTAPRFHRLIAGADAPVVLALALPGGASLRADGTASLMASGFFNGNVSFDAPDLPTLKTWYGRMPEGMEAMKTARIRARLGASGHILRFDQLAFTVNDTNATGIMDLALLPDSLPKFTGTLAFEDFDIGDIRNLLPLANRFTSDETGTAKPLAAFDLRLSASRARFGEATLANVGASVLIRADHAQLDIGDSDFGGGRLTGRLSSGPQGMGRGARLQLSLSDIDLALLGQRLGLSQLWPAGPGSLDISLSSDRPFTETGRTDLSGRATLTANEGRLNHFHPTDLQGLAARTMPLPLSEIGAAFEYNRLDAALRIEQGAVDIDATMLDHQNQRLRIAGGVSDADAVNLTASLSAAAPESAPQVTVSLGGTLSEPVVTAAAPAAP
ncbi:hypothetical protein NOF55_16945 [Rhizobiaceae bacterium BDR2-2]|uniref:AsmA protein n=1 Tax=Ectorhizobium quercum TaxID=2965071 RepID=A0AAE3N2N8_9HYPH|nr:AsmA-like C-terminal region-containing protein [Ectorhizobium quercum]MCX8996159.1 hypothetical protein [Ectorhizobium quercum]MCX8998802.1 hypothetical protein [Ectorhizobium quercum]